MTEVPAWARPYLGDADKQRREWEQGEGKAWADRNPKDAEGTDASWLESYGCKKTDVIRGMLSGWARRETTWLEPGCSAGAHMRCMIEAGWPDIEGCDVAEGAMEGSGLRLAMRYGDFAALPYPDRSFDGVTTSGTLMHMVPARRAETALAEVDRVARWAYLSFEVWQPSTRTVQYDTGMPPALLCPWQVTLPAYLGPKGWVLVSSLLVLPVRRPGSGFPFPISVNLMVRLPQLDAVNSQGIWTLW